MGDVWSAPQPPATPTLTPRPPHALGVDKVAATHGMHDQLSSGTSGGNCRGQGLNPGFHHHRPPVSKPSES